MNQSSPSSAEPKSAKQFRKKPIVIEAFQWTDDEVPSWWKEYEGITIAVSTGAAIIPTLEGDMAARPHDWIIRGVKGEVYPCKPDIFEATYEPLQSPPEKCGCEGEEMERIIIAMHEKLCFDKSPAGCYWSTILPYLRSLQAEVKVLREEKKKMREALETIKEARVIDNTQGLFADRDSIKKQFLDAHLEPIKKICDEVLSSLTL